MRGFTLFAALIIASSAFAQDGVLEINQACVADGCFDGDGAGFPVSIDQPGSYRLTSNLNTAGSVVTAISVNASNVTLDLNGFAVVGPQTCAYDEALSDVVCDVAPAGAHRLVSLSGAHITIRDGTIQGGMSVGLMLWDPGPHLVERIHVTQNGTNEFASRGLLVDRDAYALIRNSMASINSGEGFQGSDSTRFDTNLAVKNSGRGIIQGLCSNNTSVENGSNYQSCIDLGGNNP